MRGYAVCSIASMPSHIPRMRATSWSINATFQRLLFSVAMFPLPFSRFHTISSSRNKTIYIFKRIMFKSQHSITCFERPLRKTLLKRHPRSQKGYLLQGVGGGCTLAKLWTASKQGTPETAPRRAAAARAPARQRLEASWLRCEVEE